MKTVGIICEYNPFHNGHKYHIQKAKELTGADSVVCVMSGSISQRGEVCIFDKWKRASDAVKNGANLVIELPQFYVLQGADVFAYGAIKLLDSLGIVDYLCFGSELSDIDKLMSIADVTEGDEYNSHVRDYMNKGKSYPMACSLSLKDMGLCELKPNDMLGVSYIRAIKNLKSKIQPYCIKRYAVDHNDVMSNGDFASATYIRQLILEGNLSDAQKLVPYEICDDTKIYDENRMFNIVRYVISNVSDEDFLSIKGMEPGLGQRIKKSLENSNSLKELCDKAVTSRYTASRIKRLIKCIMLNVDRNPELSYVRLLSFDDRGRELIRLIKDKSQLSVINKLADYNQENLMLEWDINATDLSSYCLINPDDGADDYKTSPVYVK